MKKNLLIALLLLITVAINAQPSWREAPGDPTKNFYTIEQEFNDWLVLQNPADPEVIKECIHFARFSSFWKKRVSSNDPAKKGYFSNWIHLYGDYWDQPICLNPDEGKWKNLGPFPNRTKHNMGYVGAVWNDPDNQNFIIAGCGRYGSIWKTTDGGEHWKCTTDDERLPVSGVTSFAISPYKNKGDRIIYASTGNLHYSIGVIKSIDDGETWVKLNDFPANPWIKKDFAVRKVVVYESITSSNEDVLYASADNQLFKSINSGITWNQIPVLVTSGLILDIEFFPNDPNKIVVSTMGTTSSAPEVWYSKDGGLNWLEKMQFLPNQSLLELEGHIFLDIPTMNTVYCYILNRSGATKNVSFANNSNVTWNWSMSSLNFPYTTQVNHAFEVSSANLNNVYYGNRLMYRNGNELFPYGTSANTHCDVRAIQIVHSDIDEDNDIIIIGNDGGISKTYNGGQTWHSLNGFGENGITNSETIGFAISEERPNNIINGLIDNGTRAMNDNIWDEACFVGGDGGRCLFDPLDPDVIYGQANNTLFKTNINDLSSYTNINDPGGSYASTTYNKLLDRPIAIDPNNPDIIYAGLRFGQINRTIDGGVNWDDPSITILPNTLSEITDIQIAPGNHRIIYASTSETKWNNTITSNAIFRSIDFGLTWEDITGDINLNGLKNSWSHVTSISVDPVNPDDLWVGMSGVCENQNNSIHRVFRTFDASQGTNTQWVNMTKNLSPMPVTAIIEQPGTDDRVFVGTDAGIFYYHKPDDEWKCFTHDFPITFTEELKINRKTSEIYAGTYGRGIWKSKLPCISNGQSTTTHITSDEVWDYDRIINGDIRIATGYSLTINSNCVISMGENHSLEVVPGAKLIVDNATITSGCGSLWTGIRVHGNKYLHQFPESNQGVVIVKNGGQINSAYKAIEAIAYTAGGYYDLEKAGGIIKADGGIFRNNVYGICITGYQNPVNSLYPNRSYIENCLFETNNSMVDGYLPNTFISLSSVNKIRIQGNDFVNSSTTSDDFTLRGSGIKALNASFYAKALCLSQQLPCADAKPNTFKGLEYGIKVRNYRKTSNVVISENKFENTYRGIIISGTSQPVVTLNEFEIPDKHPAYLPTANGSESEPYGLYLYYSTGFSVEENIFTSYSGNGKSNKTNGIFVNNSLDNVNELYNNDFTSLQFALTPLNINKDETDAYNGLKLICNNFTNCAKDVDVYYAGNYSPVGICKHQRIRIFDASQNDYIFIPVENIFSHDCGGIPIPSNPDHDFDNTSAEFLIYSHRTGYASLGNRWVPNCYDNILLDGIDVDEPESLCQSKINTGTGLTQLYSNLNIVQQNLNSSKLMLDIWEDGGIEDLEEQVELTMPWEAYQEFNTLMLESPYLSEEVLIAAVENSAFSSLMIKLIMVANPQSSRIDAVMGAIYDRVPPLPESYIEEILAERTNISQLEHLQADVSADYHLLKTIGDDIKFIYLNDTIINDTITWPTDSLIAFTSRETNLNSKYELANIYLDAVQFTNMENVLTNIPSDFELSDEQSMNHQEYVNFFTILRNLKENNLNFDELSGAQLVTLNNMVDNGKHYYSAWAQCLLSLNDAEYTYDEMLVHSPDVQARIGKISEKSEIKNILKVYPNPTSEYFTIEYNTSAKYNKLWLEIHDITGRSLKKQELKSGNNAELIDVKDLITGIYMVSLYGDGEVIASERINIVK